MDGNVLGSETIRELLKCEFRKELKGHFNQTCPSSFRGQEGVPRVIPCLFWPISGEFWSFQEGWREEGQGRGSRRTFRVQGGNWIAPTRAPGAGLSSFPEFLEGLWGLEGPSDPGDDPTPGPSAFVVFGIHNSRFSEPVPLLRQRRTWGTIQGGWSSCLTAP